MIASNVNAKIFIQYKNHISTSTRYSTYIWIKFLIESAPIQFCAKEDFFFFNIRKHWLNEWMNVWMNFRYFTKFHCKILFYKIETKWNFMQIPKSNHLHFMVLTNHFYVVIIIIWKFKISLWMRFFECDA